MVLSSFYARFNCESYLRNLHSKLSADPSSWTRSGHRAAAVLSSSAAK